MRFTKSHATGNDFVVLDDLDANLVLDDDLVRALCDRRTGVGADGVIRITRGDDGVDVVMDHRNADGSQPEMCGNGLRVVAKHVLDRSLGGRDDRLVVGTRSGPRTVQVERGADGRVVAAIADMGAPDFAPAAIPFTAEGPAAIDVPIEVGRTPLRVTAVSMGNPHAVIVVDDAHGADVAGLGPQVEHHERFPQGANVGFAERVSDAALRLRVWERGVGETAACGTGACAAVVALQRMGQLGDEVLVTLTGGELRVRYRPAEHASVFLSGPVVEVAQGELDAHWLAGATR